MLREHAESAEAGPEPEPVGSALAVASSPQALARLASSMGNAAFTRLVTAGGGRALARQSAPRAQPAPVQRENLVFIMGTDRRGGANHFFALAREYAAHWNATIVDGERHRTLAGIFDYLRSRPELRVGDLYIVTHANADGDLLFPLDEDDGDRRVTYPELVEAVQSRTEALALQGQVDAGTTIRIKGCSLGRSREMVELLDRAFGGEGRVIAPTHPQDYSRIGGQVVEHYGDMLVEHPGDVHLTPSELIEEFRMRYTQIPDRWWDRVARLPAAAVLGPHGIFQRHLRTIRLPGTVEHGRGQTGRPDAYEWSAARPHGRPSAVGRLTEYRLRGGRTFQVSAEEADDQRFFTTSFSGPPAARR